MPSTKRIQEVEQRLDQTEQQLLVLQQISRLMVRKMSLPEILKAVVELVVEVTAADACLIYLHEAEELVLCASNMPHPRQIGRLRLKMGEGITGWVARERRMVAIGQQASKDPRFRFFHDLPEDAFEAFLSVPIISRGDVVGVINVQHRQSRRHTGSEIEMMVTVGEQVGCVILLAELGELAAIPRSSVEHLLSGPPVMTGKSEPR